MYVVNIFETGVEGIKLSYPLNAGINVKKIIFLNNIVANKRSKKARLDYLKRLNRIGLTFYFVTEKDMQNITESKWYELKKILSMDDNRILGRFLNCTRSRTRKTRKMKRRATRKH